MIVTLLLLMAYALIGEVFHEVLGCVMGILTIIHLILNLRWYRKLLKGKYSTFRVIKTALNFLVLGCVVLSLISGIALSRHVFAPLEILSGASFMRLAHLLASHWGFCLMSIHLGTRWNVMMSSFEARNRENQVISFWLLSAFLNKFIKLVVLYGIIAFICRGIWQYLFLKTRFAFYNFEEPIFLFLLDYLSIMVLFVFIGLQINQPNISKLTRF